MDTWRFEFTPDGQNRFEVVRGHSRMTGHVTGFGSGIITAKIVGGMAVGNGPYPDAVFVSLSDGKVARFEQLPGRVGLQIVDLS